MIVVSSFVKVRLLLFYLILSWRWLQVNILRFFFSCWDVRGSRPESTPCCSLVVCLMYIFYYIILIHTTHTLPCTWFPFAAGQHPSYDHRAVGCTSKWRPLRRPVATSGRCSSDDARCRPIWTTSMVSTIVEPPPPLFYGHSQPTDLPYHPCCHSNRYCSWICSFLIGGGYMVHRMLWCTIIVDRRGSNETTAPMSSSSPRIAFHHARSTAASESRYTHHRPLHIKARGTSVSQTQEWWNLGFGFHHSSAFIPELDEGWMPVDLYASEVQNMPATFVL